MQTKYKFLLIAALALAYACVLSPLAAQDHAPPRQTETEGAENTAPPKSTESPEGIVQNAHDPQTDSSNADSPEHSPEHSAIAVRGEHDDDSEAHDEHDKPVMLFGKEFHASGQFWLKLVNFLIFGGILFLLLKGVLSSAFRARTVEIETKLAQSEKDRLEGEAQLRELEAKMAGLEQELGGIMEKAEADAEVEKQRILETAKLEADQILAQAQSEIDYQRRLAETELRELVARLAVEGAEARIRQGLQGDSAARIMEQAIQKIGGAS